MKLPELRGGRGNGKRQVVAFGGLNYAEGAQEGELRESTGLSNRAFPALSQRQGRESVRRCDTPNAVFAWGKLCVVDGTSLLYDGEMVGTVLNGPKEFAVVNTKLCIFPDKVYLDLETKEFITLGGAISAKTGGTTVFTEDSLTMDTEELVGRIAPMLVRWWINLSSGGQLITEEQYVDIMQYDSAQWVEDKWTLTGGVEVRAEVVKVGKVLMLRKSGLSGAYTINTRTTKDRNQNGTHTIVVTEAYSENDDRGCYALVTEVKNVDRPEMGFGIYRETTITCEIHDATRREDLLTARFAVGDRVNISGCTAMGDNNVEKAVVKTVEPYKLTFRPGTFTAGTETGQVTVERPIPDLKFICESDNRLWGCEGHTIYASSLSDPKNFFVYDGLSTDSYAVAVGSDGAFTGCVAFSGDVLFWKEGCLHKVLGNSPAEYALYTYNIDGLEAGSHKSLGIMNEVLYYKGRNGVYAYTGGTPALISRALGNRRFCKAVAGSDGRRYYVSMRAETSEGNAGLYVYDTQTMLWLREDKIQVMGFATLDGVLYALESGGTLWRFGVDNAERVAWMAEMVPFTEDVLERKRPVRLLLRLELGDGAAVRVEVRQDNRPWRVVWSTGQGRTRTALIPLLPRRCDEYAVRLSGTGECIVRSLVREFQVGGAGK